MADTSQPQVVYHYTSVDTLLKIVKAPKGEECIWATDIRYLNDVKEREHCLAMMKQRLPAFMETQSHVTARLIENSLNSIYSEISSLDNPEAYHPYVASFSADGDSLPQWRAYCPNGNGVSLGFRKTALERAALWNGPGSEIHRASIAPVRYLADDAFDTVDALFTECLQEVESYLKVTGRAKSGRPPEEVQLVDSILTAMMLNRKCSHVKHISFATEQEYRLTAPLFQPYNLPYMCFRASRTTVIPYQRLLMPEWGLSQNEEGAYDDYFLDHVIVGPTPNPKLTVEALRCVFNSLLVSVRLSTTNAPYRDL